MRRSLVLALLSSAAFFSLGAASGCSSSESRDTFDEDASPDVSKTPDGTPAVPNDAGVQPDAASPKEAGTQPPGWDTGFALPGVGGRLHPTVNAMARVGNRQIALAGSFEQAGSVAAKSVALWNGNAWLAIDTGLAGSITHMVATTTGELFATVEDSTGDDIVYKVSKWNKTSWSDVATFDAPVESLDLAADGTLYVAGRFTKIGAQAIASLASWNGTAWSSVAGAPAKPTVVRVLGTKLCVGGQIDDGGFGVRCRDGGTWTPRAFPQGAWGEVSDIAEQGGALVAVGRFSVDGMSESGSIARWSGTTWELVGGGLEAMGPADVRDVQVDGTKIYVTGDIRFAGGTTVQHVAMYDTVQGRWSTLDDGIRGSSGGFGFPPPGQVLAIDQGGEIYVGGGFSLIGGRNAVGVARWDGNQWNPVDDPKARRLGVNGGVTRIVADDKGAFYVGGNFEFVGGDVAARYIARFENDAWSPLGLGLDGPVAAIATQGTTVYAGGAFLKSGTVVVPNVAKWNGATWSTLAGGVDGEVKALVLGPDGILYAGGSFEKAGGVATPHVAAFDGTGWKALGSGFDEAVLALAFGPDGKLYAAGDFTHSGTAAIAHVAKWDGAAWTALGAGVDGSASAMTIHGGKVTVGGNFQKSGTTVLDGIATWDGATWAPIGGGVRGTYGPATVSALASRGTELWAGGSFELAGKGGDGGAGTPVSFVTAWNGTTWSDVGGGTSDVVQTLLATPESVWIGGGFTFAGKSASMQLARFWLPQVAP